VSARLQQEIAMRADLIGRLKVFSAARHVVVQAGPVRAQVGLADALDHVPTDVLSRLVAWLERSAAENLGTIIRLQSAELVDWRPGDRFEEVGNGGEVAEQALVHAREYRLKRLATEPNYVAAAVATSAQGEGRPDGEIREVPDRDLQVGGSAIGAGIDHGGVLGGSAGEDQP
jgi:hypothetical protein